MPQPPQNNETDKTAAQLLLSLPEEEKIKVAEYVDSLLKIQPNTDEHKSVAKDG